MYDTNRELKYERLSVIKFKMTIINGDLKFITRIFEIVCCSEQEHSLMSRDMRFTTMWYVQPANAQISLRICAV